MAYPLRFFTYPRLGTAGVENTYNNFTYSDVLPMNLFSDSDFIFFIFLFPR